MTKAGVGFILGGVVVYLLGSQAQIGWLYVFDAMIWSMVLLSIALPWWSLRSLRIERQVLPSRSANWFRDPATPTEGTPVEVRLKVINRGRLPRFLINVVEDSPLDDPSERPRVFLLPSVKPRSEARFSYVSTCYRRGRFPSARATLLARAPLGLFVRRRHYDIPLGVTVYPAYYEMEETPVAGEALSERGQAVKSASGGELYGSREYHYGDPLRHIHWRNTARVGQFVVKQFEEVSQGSVAVAFEVGRDWGVRRETTVEYSVKIAASLAKHCGDIGRNISILAGPSPMRTPDWLEAMTYLAELSVGERASLEEQTAAGEPGRTLVTIVPARETRVIPYLSELAARESRLVVVLLEGFATGESAGEFVSRLGPGRVELVRCARGDLKAAIDSLGHSAFSASSAAGGTG